MKKIFAFVLFALAMASVNATTSTSPSDINAIDVAKLTPEQKAELLTKVAGMQKEATSPTNVSETVRGETEKWVSLGGNMGKAAVGAAREIGMAANDFVQTPLGKVTMGVVVYKVVGRDLVKLVVGSFVLLLTYGVALYFVLKKKYDSVEFETAPVFFGRFNRRVVKSISISDDTRNMHYIAAGVVTVVGSGAGFLIIF